MKYTLPHPLSSSRTKIGLVLLLTAVIAAVGVVTHDRLPASTPAPQPIPALQLDVLNAVGGHLAYCDPDQYPLAHGPAIQNARRRLPTIQADSASWEAILRYEHFTTGPPFSDDQLISINEDYKQIQAIRLQPNDGDFGFSVQVPESSSPTGNELVTGRVSVAGSVDVLGRAAGQALSCPI